MKWFPFDSVIEDSTSKFNKIRKDQYLEQGNFKIIDQSKDFIAGYSNSETLINFQDIPMIVFGDHTRVFKYIDFPLALGADGAKALTAKDKNVYLKYIYYYFKSVNLADAGYSRHFKFLKDIQIPLPPLPEQIAIANLLSKAEAMIAKRKESLALLDAYLKSTFLELFGDPVRNEKGWEVKRLRDVAKIKHGFAFLGEFFSDNGQFVLLTPGNFYEEGGFRSRGEKQKFYIGDIPSEYILKQGDLLVAMTEQAAGLLGSTLIVPGNDQYLHNQRLGLVNYNSSKLNNYFLYFFFNQTPIRREIHLRATGTKVRHTSPTKLEDLIIPLPPLELQNQFAAIVEKVEALKEKYQTSLGELEKLYGSLSQRAFRGELGVGKT